MAALSRNSAPARAVPAHARTAQMSLLAEAADAIAADGFAVNLFASQPTRGRECRYAWVDRSPPWRRVWCGRRPPGRNSRVRIRSTRSARRAGRISWRTAPAYRAAAPRRWLAGAAGLLRECAGGRRPHRRLPRRQRRVALAVLPPGDPVGAVRRRGNHPLSRPSLSRRRTPDRRRIPGSAGNARSAPGRPARGRIWSRAAGEHWDRPSGSAHGSP